MRIISCGLDLYGVLEALNVLHAKIIIGLGHTHAGDDGKLHVQQPSSGLNIGLKAALKARQSTANIVCQQRTTLPALGLDPGQLISMP